jgi:hypothetical protein
VVVEPNGRVVLEPGSNVVVESEGENIVVVVNGRGLFAELYMYAYVGTANVEYDAFVTNVLNSEIAPT